MKKKNSFCKRRITIQFLTLFILTTLFSCGNKQEKFCYCMDAGKQLNDYAQKVLQSELNSEKINRLAAYRKTKREACSAFETMGGDELLQLKAACQK